MRIKQRVLPSGIEIFKLEYILIILHNVNISKVRLMKSLLGNKKAEPLHILLVGNNPIELSSVLEKLNQLRARRVIVETAFDLKSSLERLVTFKPNFILIDDNIGKAELLETVNKFSSNKRTKEVPITVLKNSNYQESMASASILDYILKQNLSADRFYNTVKNALKFKRTQRYLKDAYEYKRGLLMRWKTKSLNLVG
jgi:PleD family two-component response regulator